MNSYYNELKSDVGIEDKKSLDNDDGNLDEVMRTLKPNTTSSNFKEFLNISDNCNRTQGWRAISRKMHSRVQKR